MFKNKPDQAQIVARSANLNQFLSRKFQSVQTDQLEAQRGDQILSMTVQMNENKSAIIKVFEKDNFFELAKNFCGENKLDNQLVGVIAETIKSNVQGASNLDSPKTNDDFESNEFQSHHNHLNSLNSKPENNVHERLFNDAERHRTKQLQRLKKSEHESANINLNLSPGSSVPLDQMYRKGQLKEQQKKLQYDQFQKDKEEKLMSECTYQPQINELSKRLIKSRPQSELPLHLMNQGKILKSKRESQQTYQQAQELFCTFHPEINPISAIIMDEKRNSEVQNKETLFQNLHQQHKTNEENQKVRTAQYFSENCPFQPQIDELSQKIVQGTTFQERQLSFMEKKDNTRNKATEKKSLESSQFKSVISRNNSKNDEQLVFENLYQQGKLQVQTRQLHQDLYHDMQFQRTQTQALSSSSKMVDAARLQSLSTLFDKLDGDGDGKINDYRINKEFLDVKRLQILFPLFEEIRVNKIQINKEQFIESCLILIQKLTIQGKHDLLFGDTKKNLPIEYSFHVQCFF